MRDDVVDTIERIAIGSLAPSVLLKGRFLAMRHERADKPEAARWRRAGGEGLRR